MFKEKTVLVTGASSGIGAALARRFAADGARLLLVARREQRLRALAEELGSKGAPPSELGRPQSGPVAKVIVADLTEDGACEHVMSEAQAAFGSVDVLVNNAGVGEYGTFVDKDLTAQDRMMHLNMAALVRLTHLALPEMLSRQSGWIMNIASAAAFQPTPYMGVYGATKVFVLNFSLSLWEEVRQSGVGVTCICPGPVRTEFLDRGGFETRQEEFSRLSLDADWVAERAYRALVKKKPVYVPGRLNSLSLALQKLIPVTIVTKLAGKVLGPK